MVALAGNILFPLQTFAYPVLIGRIGETNNPLGGVTQNDMNRAIIPIKKHEITEVGFNQYDFYYRINATDYVWCINWSDFLKKKETYIDWYVRLPLLEVTTQTPSPSLPSDEEKKKSVINKILDDLPIREVRGEMSPDEWYGWFEEVYDKAFSLCSTRIAEMEKYIEELKNFIRLKCITPPTK